MLVGRAVAERPQSHTDSAVHGLQQLRDRHARGDGVRVHDDVGAQTRRRKGHVALVQNHAARTFLSGSRRKLVADLGNPLAHDADLYERVPVRVFILPHAVDTGGFGVLVCARQVAIEEPVGV